MALLLRITPDQLSYYPGDVLNATLDVGCGSAKGAGKGAGAQLAAVWVTCTGSERVDASWVSSSYAADVHPAVKQGRRIGRKLFEAQSRPVLREALLTPGFTQRFHFRMQLPEGLPPSFKGTAVQYVYTLEAHAALSDGTLGAVPGIATSADAALATGRTGSGSGAGQGAALGRTPPHSQHQPQQQQEQIVRVTLHLWSRRDGQEKRSGSPGGGEDPQPPVALRYNIPSEELGVQLQAARPGGGGAVPPPEDGACSLMHAASRPALLGLDGSGSSPQSSQQGAPALGLPPGGSAKEQSGSGSRKGRRSSGIPETPSQGGGGGEVPSLRSYALRMGEAPLVRVAVHSPLEGPLQPGASLSGTLDFRAGREGANGAAAPRCSEVLVLLESEEAVAPQWHPSTRPGSGIIRRVWDEWQEVTPNTVLTHFTFSIPPDSPPSFATPALSLRWLLRFQFTAGHSGGGGGWGLRLGGGRPQPEQITWVLPLTVLSPGS